MEKLIAVLPGDGIGSEIVSEAKKVLLAIGQRFSHKFNFSEGIIGAHAIDVCGDPFPNETLDLCMRSDAVLFGAIGDPKYDNNPKAIIRPEQGLLKMRQELGLYANLRPVVAIPSLIQKSPLKKYLIEDVDFMVVRELTGGIYFGEPRGRSENGEKAFDSCVYTKDEVERVARKAFEFARNRNKKLTAVDKANVLATSRLWRETIQELHSEYQDVELEFMFVDNAAMQIIQNPKQFDVMVTENMFGDILTDEASVITGSIGLLPSASIGVHTSVYEPIHGSFPLAAGQNIANPIATILSAAMMLEYSFNMHEEADAIKKAVEKSLEQEIVTKDLSTAKYYNTNEIGDFICNQILEKELSV